MSGGAEVRFPIDEKPEFSLLKPGVGQNVAIYDSSTARNFFLVLISAFVVLSPSYFSKFSPILTALVLDKAVSRVGRRNKIGHPAHR